MHASTVEKKVILAENVLLEATVVAEEEAVLVVPAEDAVDPMVAVEEAVSIVVEKAT